MSKNIVIQEGGLGKQLTADKLKTNLVGGGTCLWVPEDDTHLGTKYITNNGTFKASDDGLYGYSEVTVSGIGTVTGKDPDTGEDVEVHPDPETGEIVTTVLPTEIRVITPPTKTEYTHGETINYSGIVVHAYSSTGRDMGAVPFNQLAFPETTADVQKTDGWTDGHGLNAMMLYYTPHTTILKDSQVEIIWEGTYYVHGSALGSYEGAQATYGSTDTPGTYLVTRYNNVNYMSCVAGNGQRNLFAMTPRTGFEDYEGWLLAGGAGGSAPVGRFAEAPFSDELTNIPISTVNPTTVDPANLQATQSLPVQWHRTGDGAVLETSFNINVTGGDST